MSPLAGMKHNQNQTLEAYIHKIMQRYVENSWYDIISFKLHKKLRRIWIKK